MNKVEKFIKEFKFAYPNELEYTFLNGNCYYFAVILKNVFPDAVPIYQAIDGHYLSLIDNRLYDITGDVTNQYLVYGMNADDLWTDELLRKNVEKDVKRY